MLLGAYVPVRWTRLPSGLDGKLVWKMRGPDIWGRVEINDDNGPEASLQTAMHETYHLKIKERHMKKNMYPEYAEAIGALDQVNPEILDQYEAAIDAAPDPLRSAGEESMVWLAERKAAGLPMPPVSAALAAALADVVKPRPGRLLSRLLTPLAALAGLGLLLSGGTAAAADMYEVPAGKTVRVNEHNECRLVKNSGANSIMVPTKSASEWSSGAGAFLAHVNKMPGISVGNCLAPAVVDTCYGQAHTYAGCKVKFSGLVSSNPGIVFTYYDHEHKIGITPAPIPAAHCAEPGRLPGIYAHYIESASAMHFEWQAWTCS